MAAAPRVVLVVGTLLALAGCGSGTAPKDVVTPSDAPDVVVTAPPPARTTLPSDSEVAVSAEFWSYQGRRIEVVGSVSSPSLVVDSTNAPAGSTFVFPSASGELTFTNLDTVTIPEPLRLGLMPLWRYGSPVCDLDVTGFPPDRFEDVGRTYCSPATYLTVMTQDVRAEIEPGASVTREATFADPPDGGAGILVPADRADEVADLLRHPDGWALVTSSASIDHTISVGYDAFVARVVWTTDPDLPLE